MEGGREGGREREREREREERERGGGGRKRNGHPTSYIIFAELIF
jgi:hypothetical protein